MRDATYKRWRTLTKVAVLSIHFMRHPLTLATFGLFVLFLGIHMTVFNRRLAEEECQRWRQFSKRHPWLFMFFGKDRLTSPTSNRVLNLFVGAFAMLWGILVAGSGVAAFMGWN